MKLILDVLHIGDVARTGNDKRVALVPLWNENEQYVDRPRHAGHRASCDVTLVFTGPQTGAHVPQWQLSRLNTLHIFEPAPNYLIAGQSIGTFGRGVQVFIDEYAICGRPEQCEPIR
jgi:hypothetical protein